MKAANTGQAEHNSALRQTLDAIKDIEQEFVTGEQGDSAMMLHALLSNASDLLETSNKSHHAQELTESYLREFIRNPAYTNEPMLFLVDICKVITYLVKYRIVQQITTQPDFNEILASACTVHLVATNKGHALGTQQDLLTLFEQWHGKTAPTACVTSLPAYVEYMYGPGVWELYATELEDIDLLPLYLYQNKIHARTTVSKSLLSESTPQHYIDLPNYISS